MKFILFFLTISLLATPNWKKLEERDSSKATLLYIKKDNSKDLVFNNDRLSKLINEKFNAVMVSQERYDLVNRYIDFSIPTIALIDKDGMIIFKKSNFATSTVERLLLSYLESLKTEKGRLEILNNSKLETQKIFAYSYFVKNSREFYNQNDKIKDYIFNKYPKLRLNKKIPLLELSRVILESGDVILSLWAQKHIDILINSKIYNNSHISKRSFKDWDTPSKEFLIKDNINLAKSLLILGKTDSNYFKVAKEIVLFLEKQLNEKLSSIDRLDTLSFLASYYSTDKFVAETKKEINILKNSNLLKEQISVLNAYTELMDRDFKSSLKGIAYKKAVTTLEVENFIKDLNKNFYLIDTFAYQDTKIGKEPFGFKFISDKENLELAYTFSRLYKVTKDKKYLEYSKDILTLIKKISIADLLFSKYLYPASLQK